MEAKHYYNQRFIKEIESLNPACDEVTDIAINIPGDIHIVGKHKDGFATWEVGVNGLSFYGHYDFATRDAALDDLRKRQERR